MLKVVFKHVRSAKFKSARIRTQIECWHWPLVLEVPGSVGMSNVLHRTDKVRLELRKKKYGDTKERATISARRTPKAQCDME